MTHNGGQLQVNVNFATPSTEFAFLNALKSAQGTFFASGGSPGTDWASLLLASGYPSAMPSGGSIWRKYIFIYGQTGDTWELFYPSQHTLTISNPDTATISSSTIAPGHKRITITSMTTEGGTFLCFCNIAAMSGSDWTGGISFYKTANQSDFDADPDGFDPLFLARYGYGPGKTPFGMVRTMNWGGGFGIQKLHSHRHEVSDVSWLTELVDVRYYAGTASKTLNHYTTATRFPGNPAAWTDGQIVQFWMATRPTPLTITATTMGATTSFQCVGHGLSNGEHVEPNWNSPPTGQLLTAFNTKSTTTGLLPSFAVTVTDADNFTIALNSTGFSAVGSFSMFPSVTVGDGTLAQKRCVNASFTGQFNSSYDVISSGGIVSGAYHEAFDAVVLLSNTTTIVPGVPLEIQCKLANKLKAHLWICVPQFLSGAEEQSYIQLARTNLDSELLLVLEKANEIWNPAFGAFKYAESLAAVRGSGGTNTGVGHGILVSELADSAAIALGTLATNYRVGMSLQNDVTYASAANTIQCPFLSSGNPALYPANKVDFIATAPYVRCNFSNPSWTSANYAGWVTCLQNWLAGDMQTAYDWFTDEMLSSSSATLGNNQQLDDHVNAGIDGTIDLFVAGKSAYPGRRGTTIEIWNYEGMEHNVGADEMDGGFPSGGITATNIRDFLYAYKRSPQYGWLCGRILWALKNAGVIWPSVYTAAGPWSSAKMWGQWPTNDNFEVAPPGWNVAYDMNRGLKQIRFRAV